VDAFPGDRAALLNVVATAVLPESLGPSRIGGLAGRFSAWVRNFRSGAELDHGYGITEIRRAGPSPAAAYLDQLAGLERAARRRGTTLEQAPLEMRRELIAEALRAAKIEALPSLPDGRHVAADLMAFFFRGSEANDLCHGVAIGRESCRGIPGSTEKPDALKGAP
jgi:hypothetical protein